MSFFSKLKSSLDKTRKGLTQKIDGLLANFRKVDEDFLEELEDILVSSDVGVSTTMDIIEFLRKESKLRNLKTAEDIKILLQERLISLLGDKVEDLCLKEKSIILVVGVNGAGKTTTIGKMISYYKSKGKKVLVAAGDTFRAGAIEQLSIWAQRSESNCIKHQEGSDPAAVIFDAINSFKSKDYDLLICDTAGRLQNKSNLMKELNKIFRVIDKEGSDFNLEIVLVLDGTTGQNAISQAKVFGQEAKVSSIVITKLDGTAKGGVIFSVRRELDVPVKFLCVGEGVDDIQEFEPSEFVKALIS